MNIISAWRQRIRDPLDAFLWRRHISHPQIRLLLRNEILASGACILAGAICYAAFPWLLWFGMGNLCITWLFWSWARFFLRANIASYSAAFLRAALWQFLSRFILTGVLLYAALAWLKAPPSAILAGLIFGACLALASAALYSTSSRSA